MTAQERGAVLDMAWSIRGGSVRLSLHAAEPLGEYQVTQLAAVVRRVETLVHAMDLGVDLAAPTPADILAAE